MHPSTSDLRIRATKPLIAPAVLEDDLPLDDARATLVARSRREVEAIVTGADSRLLVVVGPCSIHDHAQAMEYARQLKQQADALASDLLIVMRVYF
jgi:3-deoxy-7-phosphoheptulonate synthase